MLKHAIKELFFAVSEAGIVKELCVEVIQEGGFPNLMRVIDYLPFSRDLISVFEPSSDSQDH
jgi:hypothetical protein